MNDESKGATLRAPEVTDAERRLEALRAFLDKEGRAEFTVWANEMVELGGLHDDESEDADGIPALFDSLDDLLDALADVIARSRAEVTTVPTGRCPSVEEKA